MKAWLLIMWLAGSRITVPGIDTQVACMALADEIAHGVQFKCIEYDHAKP